MAVRGKFSRRRFLKVAGAAASVPFLSHIVGCGSTTLTEEVFPQSVASGDPKSDSVIIWTRVEPSFPGRSERVVYEVASDQYFKEIVAKGEVQSHLVYDNTVKVKVTGLQPFTTYYYRFSSRGVTSRTGRTLTAPTPDMDVNVRFAFACCQDYVGRYYHVWRLLVEEENKRGPIHFVLFLGDYIYEYETGSDVTFTGSEERGVVIPDGFEIEGLKEPYIKAALTLNDYRYLYRTYKSDPDLQRVHELYPFIVMWDDHEFANDCWQDHANDFNGLKGDERETERREFSTRAFYEYMPIDVDYNPSQGFPDDIRLYRTFRYGKFMEIFLTDQRYYRSDHVIREDEIDLKVGKFLQFTPLGSRIFAVKEGFDEREAASGVTMLGSDQFDWLVNGVTSSGATWKFIGSPVVMTQMLLDLTSFSNLPANFRQKFYFKLDQWDGYRSERAYLLSAIKGVDNVIVLSGDIHGFYASQLYENFDIPGLSGAVEFTTAGISSSPVLEQVEKVVMNDQLLSGYFSDLLPLFDDNILQSNPHIKYAKSKIYGVAIVEVQGANSVQVTFLEVQDVKNRDILPDPSYTVFSVEPGVNPLLTKKSG